MRKLILILSLALLPATSWAVCELAKDMGNNSIGCKNSEDMGLFLGGVTISCFRK